MLILCFVLVYAGIGGLWYSLWRHSVEVKKHNAISLQIQQAFLSYFAEVDDTGVTNFDKSLNNLADCIASKQANIAVASLRGQQSQALKATVEGFEEIAIEENPQAAMFLKALPAKIKKNKVAELGMNLFMQKAMQGGGLGNLLSGSGGNGKSQEYTGRKHRD